MLGTFQRDLARYVERVRADRPTADVAGPQPLNPGVAGGWENRSSEAPFKRFVIFAVGGIREAKEFNAWALAEGLRFKSLLGSYKDQHEPSFIVEDTNENRLRIAYWVKGQEAILCLGKAYRLGPDGLYRLYGNREAILDYLAPDGYSVTRREPVEGLWQPVSKNQALALDSWTFDPSQNQYYAVI